MYETETPFVVSATHKLYEFTFWWILIGRESFTPFMIFRFSLTLLMFRLYAEQWPLTSTHKKRTDDD